MSNGIDVLATNNPYAGGAEQVTAPADDDLFTSIADEVFSGAQDPEEDNLEEDTETEVDSDGDEDPDKTDKPDDAPEEDKQEDGEELETIDDDEELTLLIDGEPTKLTAKELSAGYLRHSDYTRKTQEVAEQRKALETSIDESKTALKGFAFENKKVLDSYDGVDWNKLAQTDPQQYALHKQRYENAAKEQDRLVSEFEKVQALEKIQEDQARQSKLKSANEVLSRDIPNWGADLANELFEFGQQEGLTADTLDTTDPVLIKLLLEVKKARNAKANVEKQIKVKRKVKASRGNASPVNDKTYNQNAGSISNPYNTGADFLAFVS